MTKKVTKKLSNHTSIVPPNIINNRPISAHFNPFIPSRPPVFTPRLCHVYSFNQYSFPFYIYDDRQNHLYHLLLPSRCPIQFAAVPPS